MLVQYEKWRFIDGVFGSFTKLLAELEDYDEVVQDEEKAVCLVNSFLEKYEPMIQSLIHGKAKLRYDEVMTVLKGPNPCFHRP